MPGRGWHLSLFRWDISRRDLPHPSIIDMKFISMVQLNADGIEESAIDWFTGF